MSTWESSGHTMGVGSCTFWHRCTRARHSAAVRSRSASAGGRCCTRLHACALEWASAAGRARPRPRQGDGTSAQSDSDSGRRTMTKSVKSGCSASPPQKSGRDSTRRTMAAGPALSRLRVAPHVWRRIAISRGSSEEKGPSWTAAASGAAASSRSTQGAAPHIAAWCRGVRPSASMAMAGAAVISSAAVSMPPPCAAARCSGATFDSPRAVAVAGAAESSTNRVAASAGRPGPARSPAPP